ncbi:uncharacterized protein [Haliotis cracherodii]|uniref:uncharacterized protein n=1 Tax=Haliotis cracherodii TaxID=6455 RepID=UPI001EAFD08E
MLKIALIACVVLLAEAQHTHPPHPTHDVKTHATHDVKTHATHDVHVHPTHGAHGGNEHGQFTFAYDKQSGEMVMITQTHCYLMALTDAQKLDVHDPAKIETLELQLAALASDTTKQTVLSGTSAPDHWVAAHCHAKTMVMVQN